jgi:hypothetical protein
MVPVEKKPKAEWSGRLTSCEFDDSEALEYFPVWAAMLYNDLPSLAFSICEPNFMDKSSPN